MEIKITGEWDGEKIWRQKTSAERLSEEIAKIEFKKYEEKEYREDNLIHSEDQVCDVPSEDRPV